MTNSQAPQPAHTPGPWIVTDEDYGQVIRGADEEREEHGTKFNWREYVASTWGKRTPTSEANARLIAAAPELLEALAGMVALAEQMNDASDEGGQLDARHDAALAALAKATGAQA